MTKLIEGYTSKMSPTIKSYLDSFVRFRTDKEGKAKGRAILGMSRTPVNPSE